MFIENFALNSIIGYIQGTTYIHIIFIYVYFRISFLYIHIYILYIYIHIEHTKFGNVYKKERKNMMDI